MRTRRGIFIAEDGKSVSSDKLKYSSDNPHFQINLLKEPVHMDIVEFSGGTALAMTGGSPSPQEETLLSIKHNLPYTPEVLVYFYVVSYNGSTTDPAAGQYYANALPYSGALGTVADVLYADVRGEYIYIKHLLEDFLGTTYTSDADKYAIRMKYYIISSDSHVESYDTKGY